MKLFYYKDPIGNFGDDLNPWIWYTLAPELFTSEDVLFLGIGTLINDKAPKSQKKYVFGSGVGYHSHPDLDETWHFDFVRGPRSALALGLDKNMYITDPAILVSIMGKEPAKKISGKISYMPHHHSSFHADWKKICSDAGIYYLDPAANIHETLFDIKTSELVIAEAMHAAIVADALRVPWIPVKAYHHILDFKWNDWCESMGLKYTPTTLPSIWDKEDKYNRIDKFKFNIKRHLIQKQLWNDNWWVPPPPSNSKEVRERLINALRAITENATPSLSNDTLFKSKLDQVLERLKLARSEFGN